MTFFGIKLTHNEQEAEDAVSFSFMELWLKRQDMTSYASMRSYLYTIVYNRCLNYLKHHKIATSAHTYLGSYENARSSQEIESRIVQAETMVAVYKAIELLPAHHRDVIHQTYLEEKSTNEIAEEYGKPPAHIRTARARALAALRNILKEQNLLEAAFACWCVWLSK